jgi:hypothetical protein
MTIYRRSALSFCLSAVFLLAAATTSSAVPRQYKAIWGPVERDGVSQFPIYSRLGVGIYQVTVRWDQVAPRRPARPADPADPAYRWPTDISRAVREAAARGIRVMVLVIGAPGWANGGQGWNWAPRDPRELATFMGAAARQWPGVRLWMVWTEPTKAANFQPLVPDYGRALRGVGLLPAQRYAEMLDDSYAALKRVSRQNLVIGGNTFTVGDVAPLRWIQALRLPDGRPPRFDLYGHNPFTRRLPSRKGVALGRGAADFTDLSRLAAAVDRNLRRSRRRPGPRLYLSEFSLPTDHPNAEFNFWLDRSTQASWLAAALRIARTWPRIYTLGYLGLYDDPPRSDGLEVNRGLLDWTGAPKPAFSVFQRG